MVTLANLKKTIMNIKKDDAGIVYLFIGDAVAYLNMSRTPDKRKTSVQLLKTLHPDWSDSYCKSIISHWKKGSSKYRPTLTDINRIRDLTGCPIRLFVKTNY
jgi:hypothetical protein